MIRNGQVVERKDARRGWEEKNASLKGAEGGDVIIGVGPYSDNLYQ